MAWFDDLDLPGSTVTGHFAHVSADGTDDDHYPDVERGYGTISLTATAGAVRHGGAWIGIRPAHGWIVDGEIWADENGTLPLRVLATDADTGVENWGWTATVTIDGRTLPKFTFRAPENGVHLTGNDLIPVTGEPVEVIMPDMGDYATMTDVHQVIADADLGLDDTGARNMASEWTGTGAPTWFGVALQRIGPAVTLSYTCTPTRDNLIGVPFTLPPGFRLASRASTVVIPQLDVATYGTFQRPSLLSGGDTFSLIGNNTDSMHLGAATWITADPWPDTLPGTPA